jgi:Fur family transcriptional regulator, ferric uptake regulator
MPIRDIPRLTKSRKLILDVLRMNGSHPTADQIHSRVRESLPKVSLATIYRNLDYLARYGLVSTIVDAEGRKHYDATAPGHSHIWCAKCGRIEDVSVGPEGALESMIEDDRGFEVTGHNLSFEGLCPDCRGDPDRGSHCGGGDRALRRETEHRSEGGE